MPHLRMHGERHGNMIVQWKSKSLLLMQSRLRGVAMGFFVLCLILFVYVAYGNCKAYLQVLSSV